MPPAPPRHLPPRSPLCLSTGSWSLRGSAGTASEQWPRRHRAPRLHGYTSILRACDARAVRHCAHSGGGVCVYVWGGAGQPHCKVLHLGAGRGRTPGGVHLGMPPRTAVSCAGEGSRHRQAHTIPLSPPAAPRRFHDPMCLSAHSFNLIGLFLYTTQSHHHRHHNHNHHHHHHHHHHRQLPARW